MAASTTVGLLVSFVLLSALPALYAGSVDPECSDDVLKNCTDMLQSIPSSEQLFDEFCGRINCTKGCIEMLDCTGKNLMAEGTIQGALYMCEEKSRKVILDNHECIKSIYEKEKPECMEKSFSRDMEAEKMCNATMCMSVKKMGCCYFEATRKACNLESARGLTTHFYRSMVPGMDAIGCELDEKVLWCDEEGVKKCFKELKDTVPPSTESDMDEYCKLANMTKWCVEQYKCFKSDGTGFHSWRQGDGKADGALYLCDGEPRKVFLENRECIRKSVGVAEVRCMNDSSAPSMEDDPCGHVKSYLKCLHGDVNETCDAMTANVIVTSHSKAAKAMVKPDCDIDGFVEQLTTCGGVIVSALSTPWFIALTIVALALAQPLSSQFTFN